jgi:hypothetical protein
MEEVMKHNPYPVVAAPDQGSNMGSMTRNMGIGSIEVTLDKEVCMVRMQNKQIVLALPS